MIASRIPASAGATTATRFREDMAQCGEGVQAVWEATSVRLACSDIIFSTNAIAECNVKSKW